MSEFVQQTNANMTVTVDLGERSYPIYIGADVLTQESLSAHVKGQEVVVVTNTTIAPLYLELLESCLQQYTYSVCIIDDGEQYKSMDTFNYIHTHLLEHNVSRYVTLIALGGGVVGDITGFVAATYQRGVSFIQIPTTLLSLVDSSVGGKTAVNHKLGKNMIGAFHQPVAVFSQISFLSTLPPRQYSAGMAEVIKYGLLGDKEFYVWLQDNMPALMQKEQAALAYAISRSCENKASIVARDEKESGLRALLNLGHTFGHAIEALESYKGMLHGEAVAVGMLMAADLSSRLAYIQEDEVIAIKQLIEAAQLPTRVSSNLNAQEFRRAMNLDKKNVAGKLRLILLKSIGHAELVDNVDEQLLMQTIEAFV